MSNECPLKVENLSKNYGNLKAIEDISFSLNPGEIFSLLGPNGAGKTTIISIIMSLVKACFGEVVVFGKNALKYPKFIKKHIGFVPQELIHHGFFTLEEVLVFHFKYFGIYCDQKYLEYLLRSLDLWQHKHKYVNQLSGGMKRRVLIAKALVHRPKILLLDEPTAGVDIELKDTLWKFIVELKNHGTSILLTTHYLEEAQQLSDRVGILHLGKLRFISKLSDLLKTHGERHITLTLKESIPSFSSKYLIKQRDNTLIFSVPSTYTMADLMNELTLSFDKIKDIKIGEGNLEEIFRTLLQEYNDAK